MHTTDLALHVLSVLRQMTRPTVITTMITIPAQDACKAALIPDDFNAKPSYLTGL